MAITGHEYIIRCRVHHNGQCRSIMNCTRLDGLARSRCNCSTYHLPWYIKASTTLSSSLQQQKASRILRYKHYPQARPSHLIRSPDRKAYNEPKKSLIMYLCNCHPHNLSPSCRGDALSAISYILQEAEDKMRNLDGQILRLRAQKAELGRQSRQAGHEWAQIEIDNLTK